MTTLTSSFLRRRAGALTAAITLLVALNLLSTGALAQSQARVFELRNRPASDVASQIRSLYQDTSLKVTARGQQVVVRGDEQLLDEIDMLIGTLDVAAMQLRITVRSREDIGGKRSGAGFFGSEDRVNVNVERKVTSTNNASQRSLVVQDGQSAHVTSGQVRTLPFAIQGGRNPAAILQQVETRSGFLVSPQVISDRAIELNIVSFEEDPASLPGYETEALVTVRRVEPGQWVTLGSTSTEASSQRSGITYSVSSSRGENRSFEVKVDILP